jgi:triosephosphate isomerase (TIM)
MRKPMVAGNWKMNGSGEFTRLLLRALIEECRQFEDRADVVVCPPFVYLDQSSTILEGQVSIALGAQNLDAHASGAYTGEVSASMLLDVGCRYVIVGHSERRALYGESNETVASKVGAALEAGLIPILCLGETLEQREAGETMVTVGDQLDAVVDALGAGALDGFIVAYEPVWAIGTGKTATPDQAQEVHHFIRERLCSRDEGFGTRTRILYGGSVKPDNAVELFSRPDIDGGLIGGASLDARDFLTICSAAG